ncbi:tryptophan synthase subunit alpha [Naasia lichenicola]|uniref:Tryptophan synthase alpha chain n=1 Tax=Naasia lichenicola TaxID=2565933 RepID=A0A4S4FR22_9MICO|nr:tryptophan synthase subunit alpha [Naasia lichenicola]THG33073.1 tryptophan synthase subunit alpha [Naasia lichenicola]
MSGASSSTSPVAARISQRRDDGTGALVGYLPIGFPDLDTSIEAAVALVENGVDILELGLPYSDPVMDGPVIQAAAQQSLANGFKLRHAFDAVRAVKERVSAPVLLMTYWNPIIQFGVDSFADQLQAAGGAGLITPDLVPDEATGWLAASDRTGLDRVFLAAPSSSETRLRRTAEVSRGFVYAVSTMGITGARADVDRAARGLVGRLRDVGVDGESAFTCVGIGISTGKQVREVLGYADGAIVGSALVAALAEGGVSAVAACAAGLSEGTAPVGADDAIAAVADVAREGSVSA